MNKFASAAMLILIGVPVCSAQKQRYSESRKAESLDYPLVAHVTHARVQMAGTESVLHIEALINGTHVELEAGATGLLHTGDYQARLVNNEERKSGWFSRSYELLFSDGTHVVFKEVAESE